MDLTTQGKNGQQKLLLDSQLTEDIFESNDARPGPTMVLYNDNQYTNFLFAKLWNYCVNHELNKIKI